MMKRERAPTETNRNHWLAIATRTLQIVGGDGIFEHTLQPEPPSCRSAPAFRAP